MPQTKTAVLQGRGDTCHRDKLRVLAVSGEYFVSHLRPHGGYCGSRMPPTRWGRRNVTHTDGCGTTCAHLLV